MPAGSTTGAESWVLWAGGGLSTTQKAEAWGLHPRPSSVTAEKKAWSPQTFSSEVVHRDQKRSRGIVEDTLVQAEGGLM